MEYACKVVGSKILVVLGHTNCGAINAACKKVAIGNLLEKIDSAIEAISCKTAIKSQESMNKVAKVNVKNSIQQILAESTILNDLEKSGDIEIIGAI